MEFSIDDMPKGKRLVGLPEVGFRLSLQPSAIYALFRRGDLTPVKLMPKKTVVLEEELEALIQRRFDEARQKVSA